MDLPRQYARTRRFTLGVPHGFCIAPDSGRVAFLRSRSGDDPVTCLWVEDPSAGAERLIADPGTLLSDGCLEQLAESARREFAAGVTEYSADQSVRQATFTLSGRLWIADLVTADVRELPAVGPVAAPRLDPGGQAVAYVTDGSLRIISTDGSGDRALAEREDSAVSYGLPEYVASEWGRDRGYWWSPDSDRILVARVDTTPVRRWHLTDPSDPGGEPTVIRYPAAGTPNADVTLWVVSLDGRRVEIRWDSAAFEYVIAAHWGRRGLVVVVQSRDQKTVRVLAADPGTGTTQVLREDTDPCWVYITPGLPALTAEGALVWAKDTARSRALLIDGKVVTPPELEVREVMSVDGDTVLFAASGEPTEIGLWTYSAADGLRQATVSPGVHEGRRAGGTTVIAAESLEHDGVVVTVEREGSPPTSIASRAEPAVVRPQVELSRAGALELRTAVVFPSWHKPGTRRLPVLMDPYGGPGGQRVLAARRGYLLSQWFADQGFAVVIADGRGTPGRGSQWERAIYGDKGTLALEDQVVALHAAAERYPDLDLERVGIRGWSFGGYLAALAVLRQPDIFHAAVAGAPVSDQRLYNTHWNERYLGHPRDNLEGYARSSLLPEAGRLRRPLMLIHGLADSNVFPAHTFLLSSALTAAGRPHTVLPLPGMTHRPAQQEIVENILILQAGFLKKSLNVADGGAEDGAEGAS